MDKASANGSVLDALDYAAARQQMVDDQIRPLQVSDPRILAAMRAMPRHRFVPEESAALAYADRPVRLGGGRTMMEPRIIARLLQVLVPRAGERALVVAAGSGYAAALLQRLGLVVVALEPIEALAAQGVSLCTSLAPGVRFVRGELAAGWAGDAPYEMILIDGAVAELPPSLAGQIAVGGRVGAVLRPGVGVGTAVIAEPSSGGLRARPQFDAQAELIPELAPRTGFTF